MYASYADPFTSNSNYLLLLFFLLHAYIYINSKKEPTLSDYEINNSYIIQIYIECLGVGT